MRPSPPMRRLRLLIVALLATALLVPARGAAQERGRERAPRSSGGSTNPRWFASLGAGFQVGDYVVDDASQSTWDFDAGVGLRADLTREVAPRVAVGVAFNYARLPLTWASTGATIGCARCSADATVSSYGALARFGGGLGFHQVAELFLGAMRYGNFVQHATGTTLAPTSNTDVAFGAGYGFGYGISPDWQVVLVQDVLNSLHERSELGGGRMSQHYTTRLGVRVGF